MQELCSGETGKFYIMRKRRPKLRGAEATSRLAYYLGDRYFGESETTFLDLVISDLSAFQLIANKSEADLGSKEPVLVFPPVTNYHRFLIHKLTEEEFPTLKSFSVGKHELRRTVICRRSSLLMSQQVKNESNDKTPNEPCRAKSRRPDKQLYIPRAKREAQQNADMIAKSEIVNSSIDQGSSGDGKMVSSSTTNIVDRCEKKAAGEKFSLEKKPSELKKVSDGMNCEKKQSKKEGKVKMNQKNKSRNGDRNKKLQPVNTSNKAGDLLKPKTFQENGRDNGSSNIPDASPSSKDSNEQIKIVVANDRVGDGIQTENVSKNITDGNLLPKNSDKPDIVQQSVDIFHLNTGEENTKDTEDLETYNEQSSTEEYYLCQDYFPSSDTTSIESTKTSTVEISHSSMNKTIEISCVDKNPSLEFSGNDVAVPDTCNDEAKKKNSKDDVSDITWENMYSDDGECLHPELVKELTDNIGQVKIEKAKLDYTAFQPREPVIGNSEFNHVIEIYDFPAEFKTTDLVAAFSQFPNRGFDIKWVDDTHALGLFASPIAAADALTICHPFIKTRPLCQASRESKLKARKCAEFLQPYRPRPETSASLARRLVGGALGLQVHVSKEQREKERQKLREAKEKKRHAAKQKNEIWDGIIQNSLAKVS